MSHIPEASHNWQPLRAFLYQPILSRTEITLHWLCRSTQEINSPESLFHLTFLELRAEFNLVQSRQEGIRPNPSSNLVTLSEQLQIWMEEFFILEWSCGDSPTTPSAFITQKALFKRCVKADLCGVYVPACQLQVLPVPPSLTCAVTFLALSHRCQQWKNTMVLQKDQPCVTFAHFKRWLHEHTSCSQKCLKIQKHWTTKIYSLAQH